MKTKAINIITVLLVLVLIVGILTSCSSSKEKVLIYTTAEDYKIEYYNQRMKEKFPEYEVVFEYMSTGNLSAKLVAEGNKAECDIIHELEYGYLDQLTQEDILADISYVDISVFMDDTIASKDYIVAARSGGSIIVNTEELAAKGLAEPTSYEDLLKPEYMGLISMPNPKSSGTGFMFLKSLVNAWGEDKAFEYFDQLTPNILQYTSSGSGPVNSLIQGEVAVAFGLTAQAVTQINEGNPLKLIYFDEGSPYTFYGLAMLDGKEKKSYVKEVFDFFISDLLYENNEKFSQAKIFKDKDYMVDNFPTDINYSDMSNNTIDEKIRLLEKWKY